MTSDTDFFRLDQEQWFSEFVEHELSTKVQDTHHPEKFTLEDIPF